MSESGKEQPRTGLRLYEIEHDEGAATQVTAATRADAIDWFRDRYSTARIERMSEVVLAAGGELVRTNVVTHPPIGTMERVERAMVSKSIREAREQEEARRVDDDYLSDLQRLWQMASKGPWRVEKQRDGDRHKLYAVSPPNTHDAYLLDLSAGDAKYAANLDAIAKAPEHVAALLAEVKRLREENAQLRAEHARNASLFTHVQSWLGGWFSTRPGNVNDETLQRNKAIHEDFVKVFSEDHERLKTHLSTETYRDSELKR